MKLWVEAFNEQSRDEITTWFNSLPLDLANLLGFLEDVRTTNILSDDGEQASELGYEICNRLGHREYWDTLRLNRDNLEDSLEHPMRHLS